MYAGPGNDRLDGRGGSDLLAGSKGNDTIYALDSGFAERPQGQDTVKAGFGSDTVDARDGVRDAIDCGEDRDGRDKDTVYYDLGRLDTVKNCERKNP